MVLLCRGGTGFHQPLRDGRHRADALGPNLRRCARVVAKAGEYFREQLRHVEVALADGRSF